MKLSKNHNFLNMHACRYSHLLPFSSSLEQIRLGEEFIQYQLLSKEDIPKEVWDAACAERFYRMDIVWHHLANLKGGDDRLTFPWLSKVAKLVLTLPHSNSGKERVFLLFARTKLASVLTLAWTPLYQVYSQ